MLRAWRAQYYIFKEMLPSFFLGMIVFVFVLLLFQALRLTEFILVQGVDKESILYIVYFLVQSFLPAILPMSSLFAVLFCYSRLSADSEIVAFRAIGLNMKDIGIPAIVFGAFASLITLYTVMYSGPKGNREFEIIVGKLARQKSHTRIQEGTFSQGFQGMIIYTQKYNSQKGLLEKVFIYDDGHSKNATSIIAERGQIIQSNRLGNVQTILRLIDGSIHQPDQGNYTKIDFKTYDIFASNEVKLNNFNLSPTSLVYEELQSELSKRVPRAPPESNKAAYDNYQRVLKRRVNLETEFHKRWVIGLLPMIFAVLGLAQGAVTNRRSGGGNSFVLSMAIIISFWILYITSENLAKSGSLPIPVAMWSTNVIFSVFALYKLKKIWN